MLSDKTSSRWCGAEVWRVSARVSSSDRSSKLTQTESVLARFSSYQARRERWHAPIVYLKVIPTKECKFLIKKIDTRLKKQIEKLDAPYHFKGSLTG
ncbi:hypothetical protein AVEN_127722-1 [Araneus ventricosus]|uniref:Uncharacterized protein n=1 Tax=Araneus ventricosus TaxID=182803 RepID=A0A4Y2WFG4_ARAVE|nr:hypothetical protein AVEN_127722-1 [Araneus ventricosus]